MNVDLRIDQELEWTYVYNPFILKTYLIFDLSPWQLSNSKLHQHVEQGPQVIMATHFLEIHKIIAWLDER